MIYKSLRRMWKERVRDNSDVNSLERIREDLRFKQARLEENTSNLVWLIDRVTARLDAIARSDNAIDAENADEPMIPFAFEGKLVQADGIYYLDPNDGEDAITLDDLIDSVKNKYVQIIIRKV